MNKRYFNCQELVVMGVFAASTKVVTLIIALAGGGPNPISIMLKNMVFTTLLVVLIYKIPKFGTLTLFNLVSAIVSLIFLGGGVTSIPLVLMCALLSELLVMCLGGYKRFYAPIACVAFFDLFSRLGSIGLSYLFMREMPEMLLMVALIIAVGYVGAIIGLFTGLYSARELRHAGIINK